MSLKSLVISFPWPCHYSSPALPLWPFLSLSRCSSHPALLQSQRLKIKEIKHRYWVLACELPLCKGETSLPALLSIAWHGRPPLVRAFLLQEHFHPLPKHLRFHYCRPFSWIHRHESLRELDWSWQQKLSQWITVTEKGLPASKNLFFWNERELVDGFFTSANALLSSPLYNRLRYKYYHYGMFVQSVIFTTPFIWKVETSGIHWTTIQEEFIVSLYQLEMMAISWKLPCSAVCQKWGHCPQFQQSGQPDTSTTDECNFFTLHFARIEGSALNSGNLAGQVPPPEKKRHLGG